MAGLSLPSSPGSLPAAGLFTSLSLARFTLAIFTGIAGLFSFTRLPLPGLFAFPCPLPGILASLAFSILSLPAGSLAARATGESLASRRIPAPPRRVATFGWVGQRQLRGLLSGILRFSRIFLPFPPRAYLALARFTFAAGRYSRPF